MLCAEFLDLFLDVCVMQHAVGNQVRQLREVFLAEAEAGHFVHAHT